MTLRGDVDLPRSLRELPGVAAHAVADRGGQRYRVRRVVTRRRGDRGATDRLARLRREDLAGNAALGFPRPRHRVPGVAGTARECDAGDTAERRERGAARAHG